MREASQNGEVKLTYINTEHQVADLFTKSLPASTFIRLRDVLMGSVPLDEMIELHMKKEVKVVNETMSFVIIFSYLFLTKACRKGGKSLKHSTHEQFS